MEPEKHMSYFSDLDYLLLRDSNLDIPFKGSSEVFFLYCKLVDKNWFIYGCKNPCYRCRWSWL